MLELAADDGDDFSVEGEFTATEGASDPFVEEELEDAVELAS